MLGFFKKIHNVLYSDITKRNKKTPFIIFISFLVSFILARSFTYFFQGFNILDPLSIYHIHHFFYGVIFLVVSNWISLVSNRESLQNIASGIFGFGMGLVADEIGLFLTCGTEGMECDYWTRITYDVVVVVILIFLTILYLEPFLRGMKKIYGKVKTNAKKKN